MAARPGRSVLSLQDVALADRQFSAHTARLDLELPHGEVALVQVEDEHDAAMLVDLCLGLADPGAGQVRFLGVDWTTHTPRERFHHRRRIGAVVQTDVWPSHMTVLESVLGLGPTISTRGGLRSSQMPPSLPACSACPACRSGGARPRRCAPWCGPPACADFSARPT